MAELIILEHEKEQSEYPLREEEKKVAGLIMEHSPEEYHSVLRDADWDTFYQLSVLREGLLNWYPFNKNSEILEISSGFGALTGVLSRNSRKVTVLEESLLRAECIAHRYAEYKNITILVGDMESLSPTERYDYIIVETPVNTKCDLDQLLDKVCPFQKETSRLLFVCENRFGMKYWCGVPDPVRRQPFAGIRGRDVQGLLTRQDLIDALETNSHVGGWSLYYPFPDCRLPQAVYTDSYLPQASVRDRVIPYYSEDQREALVCLENEFSDELIANKVFHVFANSFLVECGSKAFQAETIYAALSTDRGNEHGFATVISSNEKVQKRVLHPDGKPCLELIHRNSRELEAHGISCVPETLLGDMIEMPFINEHTLIDYLKFLFLHEKHKVEGVFEHLYNAILQSSEHISFSECAIRDSRLTEKNAGPILRKAYIDMIPYNCFEVDGELLFYDQEFVRECYPAKYVLFRALRYTYVYIPEADGILPLQYFKEKYDLGSIWQVFEREECRFIEVNRNYDLMTSFYRWAGINSKDIDRNIEKLRKKVLPPVLLPFKRHRYDLSMYNRDTKLNAVKAVQLDLLEHFIEVCEKYDLSYCMFYGTLLGTVRHKGYIPWDDDVDLLMPRVDYDKLLQIAPEAFPSPYFLQTPLSDTGCFYGGYSKLRNSNTTGLEERNKGHQCNQGIWIDIFPLDGVPKDEAQKRKQHKKIVFYQRLLLKKTYPEKRVLWDITAEQEKSYCRWGKFFSRQSLCRRLNDAFIACEAEESDKVAVLARYWGKKAYKEYDRNIFEFLIRRQFENLTIYIPSGYEECLREEYGAQYMQYPPDILRVPHHKATFDTQKSYVDYLR